MDDTLPLVQEMFNCWNRKDGDGALHYMLVAGKIRLTRFIFKYEYQLPREFTTFLREWSPFAGRLYPPQ